MRSSVVRIATVGAAVLLGIGGWTAASSAQETTTVPPEAPSPFDAELTIDTTEPLVLAADGSIAVSGTLTCAVEATVIVTVEILQGPSYGPPDGGSVSVDCSPEPVTWSTSLIRSLVDSPPFTDGAAFVRGSIFSDEGDSYFAFTGDIPAEVVSAAAVAAPAPAPRAVTAPAFTG